MVRWWRHCLIASRKRGGGAGLEGELQRLYFKQRLLQIHIPSQSSGQLFLTSKILIPFEAVCTVAMEMTETTGGAAQ